LYLPYRSIQNITYPLIGRLWKDRDMASVAILYRKTTLVMMIIGGGIILLLFGNMDAIFMFIPEEYSVAKYSFVLLCISKYADMASGLNGIIVITSKKYKYDLLFILLLTAVTIVLNLILIPRYGITGAAIATMWSIIFYNLFRLIFVWYYFKIQPFTLKCLWILLITIGTWAIVYFIPFVYNKYISICINSAVIVFIYAGLMLFFRFSPEINNMVFKITGWNYLKTGESMFE